MKLLINEKKEVVNLFWENEQGVDIDISSIQDLKKEHEANIEFVRKYGVSKYYVNDQNELQVRSEAEILGFEKELKIKQLNEIAGEIITKKYPIHKQLNMDRGAKKYKQAQIDEKNAFIDKVLDQVAVIETTIKTVKSVAELNSTEIKING